MALPAGRYGVTKNQLLKIKKLPMNTIKLIEELTEKFDLLGSAAFKNSISVVTDSTDLVESGAVKELVGWGNKNLLPNNAVSITTKGITFTVNADGSVTANGTCTQNVDFYYSGYSDSLIPLGNIQNGDILNGCTGGSANTYSIVAGNLSSGYGTCTDGDVALTDITNGIRVVIRVKQGVTLNNVVFKPMIRKADVTDATYEPYHASVDESKCDNSVIAPVENGTTASQAYAVGSHFIRNGAFCTVTTAISSGESLVGSSKFTSGDVASEFNKQTFIPQTADLNDFKTFGWYYWNEAPTNSPESATYVQMQIVGGSGIKQIVYKPNAIYIRNFTGAPASWKNWYKYEGTIVS